MLWGFCSLKLILFIWILYLDSKSWLLAHNYPNPLSRTCFMLQEYLGPAAHTLVHRAERHLFSSAQSCPTLCDPMDCSTPGFLVHHQLPELPQTCARWVGDAIQPSHPLPSPSPSAFNLYQHQGIFQWVSSLHQVAKVLEFQLQH